MMPAVAIVLGGIYLAIAGLVWWAETCECEACIAKRKRTSYRLAFLLSVFWLPLMILGLLYLVAELIASWFGR